MVAIYKSSVPENPEYWSSVGIGLAFLVFLNTMVSGFSISKKWQFSTESQRFQLVEWSDLILFGAYLMYTFLITGSYLSLYRPERFLYVPNFAVILVLKFQCYPQVNRIPNQPQKALYLLLGIMPFLLVI